MLNLLTNIVLPSPVHVGRLNERKNPPLYKKHCDINHARNREIVTPYNCIHNIHIRNGNPYTRVTRSSEQVLAQSYS